MRVVSVIAGGLLLGLLAVALHWDSDSLGSAPDVDFQLIDGHRLEMARLRGHPVLVNFWSTRCAPCLEEMPLLSELYRRLSPKGMEMVAVAMPFDRPDQVLEVSRRKALPYPVALDISGEVGRAFGGIAVTPTSILVDAEGMMVLRHQGPLDGARLEARINPLL